jgi:hypothetical protein
LPGYGTPDTPVYAVYPHSHFLSAKTRTFIDFLASRFAHLPQIKQNGHDRTSIVHAPPNPRTATDEMRHSSVSSN